MKVFVSHCSQDDNKRIALASALEKNGFEPVVVVARQMPGMPLVVKVTRAIQEADTFVPILTSASIANQWVNQEIGYARGIEKPILPIVETAILGSLKGFVHAQDDLPFTFQGVTARRSSEASNFRRAYAQLIQYLRRQEGSESAGGQSMSSSIAPRRARAGSDYTTTVTFSGSVENGFFDNYVIHSGSSFTNWDWDPITLPHSSGPGTLNGNVSVSRSYRHSTKGWPLGWFTIHVRLYSHSVGPKAERVVVAENVHSLELY
jgi:hypothetical protein